MSRSILIPTRSPAGRLKVDTAQARFKEKYHQYLAKAFLAAIVLHFVIFYLFPPFEFTPYKPLEDWTTIVVEPEPVPIVTYPDEIKNPEIQSVPYISEKPGDEEMTIPITSPEKIRDIVIGVMPRQEIPEFVPWDRKPVLLKYFAPVYPWSAKTANIEGSVLLRVTIGTNGKVEAASIIRSDGTPAMEKAALAAVMKYEFEPAMQQDVPVRSLMAVPIRFKLH